MPFERFETTVTRGTICKTSFLPRITIAASDQIPTGTDSPLFISIEWFKERINNPGQPDDAHPVELILRRQPNATGEIQFVGGTTPQRISFPGNTHSLLTIRGISVTAGTQPDVLLDVKVDGSVKKTYSLSVGQSAATVEIKAENGTDPAPRLIPLDTPTRFKAVIAGTTGTFQWISALPDVLTIAPATATQAIVEVTERRPPVAQLALYLMVLFQPQTGPAVLAVHTLDVRESIVFVMGNAEPRCDGPIGCFYRAAYAYFALNPATHAAPRLHSLREIRDYLENNPPANGLPWGEINIVTHATEMGSMSLMLLPTDVDLPPAIRAAGPTRFEGAIARGDFPALPDRLIDRHTVLRIRGCALGRQQNMLHFLSVAFGGNAANIPAGATPQEIVNLRAQDRDRPIVRAPKHIQHYTFHPLAWQPGSGRLPNQAEEFLDEIWIISFRPDQRPANRAALAAAFEREHGDASRFDPPLNWQDALSRSAPRTRGGEEILGDPFQQERDRTYTFILRFEARSDRPSLPTTAARMAWLREQANIQRDMELLGMQIDDFQWNFDFGNVRGLAAITAVGHRTVIRVQRILTEPDPTNPGQRRVAHPPLTDPRHYGVELPPR